MTALVMTLSGCSTVGPVSISRGRADYKEAINKTDYEQLLRTIVKSSYGETSRLLALTDVAANIRFSADADAEAEFGVKALDEWSFVPFKGGVAYDGYGY